MNGTNGLQDLVKDAGGGDNMAILEKWENNCNGCPECKGCGRDKDYLWKYLVCDKCGESVEELYEYDDKWYCDECITDVVLENAPKITEGEINDL